MNLTLLMNQISHLDYIKDTLRGNELLYILYLIVDFKKTSSLEPHSVVAVKAFINHKFHVKIQNLKKGISRYHYEIN